MQLINSAADCTIKTFIECSFDRKFKGLIIAGKPTEEELAQALNNIETEFTDLTGNIPPELKLINRINELTARNLAVHWCFVAVDEMLRRADAPLMAALPRLKKQGINIKWNDDIEDFRVQVKNAKTREISKHVQLEELTMELEAVQKKQPAPQSSKKEFYKLIHAVQALGFKVSEHETNMYSFGIMCSSYYEMIKKQGDS